MDYFQTPGLGGLGDLNYTQAMWVDKNRISKNRRTRVQNS